MMFESSEYKSPATDYVSWFCCSVLPMLHGVVSGEGPHSTLPFFCYFYLSPSDKAKDFSDYCLRNISQGWTDLTTLAIGGPSLTLTGLSLIGKKLYDQLYDPRCDIVLASRSACHTLVSHMYSTVVS